LDAVLRGFVPGSPPGFDALALLVFAGGNTLGPGVALGPLVPFALALPFVFAFAFPFPTPTTDADADGVVEMGPLDRSEVPFSAGREPPPEAFPPRIVLGRGRLC
jgi:hypothetical protein